MYEWFKIIHVVSAAILFGTGFGSALYKYMANRSRDVGMIANATKSVVYADWIFTGTSGIVQPVTGIIMVMIKGYSITTFWVLWSIVGYLIAAICWFPVAAIQIKLAKLAQNACEQKGVLPPKYRLYYRLWIALGIPAFCSLVVVVFLMANRPESYVEAVAGLFGQ